MRIVFGFGRGEFGSMKSFIREWFFALPKPERILLFIFAGTLAVSFIALLANSYLKQTNQAPAYGGSITIGFVGTPHYINPVIAPANEVDRALIKLVYPSLLHYDQKGALVPFLAERYAVGDNGKVYDVFLKKNAKWEDGQAMTAKDVVFTIKTIQDPKASSPLVRLWQGVGVEALDDYTLRFTLSEPYAFFLQNLTVGILPKHIWESIGEENFSLSEYNKKPVGGGPYRFSTFTKTESAITSIVFKSNATFFGRAAYIPKVTVRFYATPQDLFKAYQSGEVEVAGLSAGAFDPQPKPDTSRKVTPFMLPRYFAIFLNESVNPSLRKKEVRQALWHAINREALIVNVLGSQAQIVNSPIPSVLSKYASSSVVEYPFDIARAGQLLAANGFSLTKPLVIELTIIDDELLGRVAETVVSDWREAGIQATIRRVDINQLRDQVLQKRTYQTFLFGQALALEPDPFSLWHSSQVEYPGFNLSMYRNKTADSILEELRKTFDEQRKKELFAAFQATLTNDVSTIFLYSPYYLVFSPASLYGLEAVPVSLPEDYINGIGDWYIYTKRIVK